MASGQALTSQYRLPEVIVIIKADKLSTKMLPGHLPLPILYSIVKLEGFLKGDTKCQSYSTEVFLMGRIVAYQVHPLLIRL